ncbi:hypothetical protein MMC19_003778 [Ptychographa xylographoides]|nr:hypothetical protein [Ptychographa xylographoides]
MTLPFYFSSPFNDGTESEFTNYPPSASFDGSRKRKRSGNIRSDHESEEHAADVPIRSIPGSQTSLAGLSSFQAERKFSSVLYSDLQGKSSAGAVSSWKLTEELTSLKPPLTLALGRKRPTGLEGLQTGLKQRHLAALTTVMHKCLIQGDFLRAGRAWGMLLRAEVKGRRIDVRANGLWGLGAEVLLQSAAQEKTPQRDRLEQDTALNCKEMYRKIGMSTGPAYFSKQRFEDARAYYERLIVQFPWRQWLPDSINAINFYLAMFGLWINKVQEEHTAALGEVALISKDMSDERESPDTDPEADSIRREYLRQSILRSATEVADRLDDLLSSFPFSDNVGLCTLRGMLDLWIGDLSVVQVTATGSTIDESNSENGMEALVDLNLERWDTKEGPT